MNERQAEYAAIVIDFFQARGTMAKMNEYFVEDAIYEDLFATCKNRIEVGESANVAIWACLFSLLLSPSLCL